MPRTTPTTPEMLRSLADEMRKLAPLLVKQADKMEKQQVPTVDALYGAALKSPRSIRYFLDDVDKKRIAATERG